MYDEELALKTNLIPDFRPKCVKHWIYYKNFYILSFFIICLFIMIGLIIWSIFLEIDKFPFKYQFN